MVKKYKFGICPRSQIDLDSDLKMSEMVRQLMMITRNDVFGIRFAIMDNISNCNIYLH